VCGGARRGGGTVGALGTERLRIGRRARRPAAAATAPGFKFQVPEIFLRFSSAGYFFSGKGIMFF